MRVCGELLREPYTRFGFSPQAIFNPYGAPGNFMPSAVRDGTFLTVTPRPPNRFADPGRICMVVTPPASDRSNWGCCGQMECSADTSAVFGLVTSLPSCSDSIPGAAYTPRCECVSMIPGVTHFAVASITTASAGAFTVCPTAATLPSRSRIDPCSIGGPAAVRIVASRISVVRDGNGLYVDAYAFGTTGADPVCCGAGSGGVAGRWGVSGGVGVRSPGVAGFGAPGGAGGCVGGLC